MDERNEAVGYEPTMGPLPNPAEFSGVLKVLAGRNCRGDALFTDSGIVLTGVPVPYEGEVVGLPVTTRFVPFSNIQEFVFDTEDGE